MTLSIPIETARPAPDAPGERDREGGRDGSPRLTGFATLYREHVSAVAGAITRRTGDPHVAEDLTAEVFVAALENLDRYRRRQGVPFRHWLLGIAHRQINQWARSQRRRARREWSYARREAAGRARAGAQELLDSVALRIAYLALRPSHQEVLALHYFEGLSVEEIAGVARARLGTVKSRLHRARRALESLLENGD